MHTPARIAFVGGAVLATGALSFATLAALTPKPVPITQRAEVAIAKIPSEDADFVLRIEEPSLVGLDATARRLRGGGWAPGYWRGLFSKGLPVYLVRHDGQLRAFIGIDPRSGCAIDYRPQFTKPWGTFATGFYDVCHGSVYDLAGAHTGGPSPWALDQLVIRIDGGLVYASTKDVVAGCSFYAMSRTTARC